MNIPVGLARQALAAKKHAPTLLFGAGVVGTVTSTVLACRGTLRLHEVLEATQRDLELARNIDVEEYTEQDRKKDIAIIYTRTTIDMVKLYGPAIVVGGLSIAALTQSHNLLSRRNASLAAAYAALEKGFNEYRERVADRYGEDVEREIRFPREKIKETNPETGREHTVEVIRDDAASVYARFFDPTSTSWSKEPEYNLVYLKNQQNYFNDLLRARGHVFLNEVYDELGIPRSKAGALVGWTIGNNGDNYIDFGIFDRESDATRSFVNGRENSILLDFNVDGLIYNQLDDISQEALSWQKGE